MIKVKLQAISEALLFIVRTLKGDVVNHIISYDCKHKKHGILNKFHVYSNEKYKNYLTADINERAMSIYERICC